MRLLLIPLYVVVSVLAHRLLYILATENNQREDEIMDTRLAEKLETARHGVIDTLIRNRLDPRVIEEQLQAMMSIERELYGKEDFANFEVEPGLNNKQSIETMRQSQCRKYNQS
jgi:tRNA U38,U39,U40 pseudouridine synthase TruA